MGPTAASTTRRFRPPRLGSLALACAATDDVLALSLLAVVVAVASLAGAGSWLILLVVPYLALMFRVVRPFLRRHLAEKHAEHGLTVDLMSTVLAGVLISGAITERIGLHFIFGAFLFGVIVPRKAAEPLHRDIAERVGQVNSALLLPVFFLAAGLKVDLSHVGLAGLGELALILLVAIGGKFVGAFLTARRCRIRPRHAATLATLMNTPLINFTILSCLSGFAVCHDEQLKIPEVAAPMPASGSASWTCVSAIESSHLIKFAILSLWSRHAAKPDQRLKIVNGQTPHRSQRPQ